MNVVDLGPSALAAKHWRLAAGHFPLSLENVQIGK